MTGLTGLRSRDWLDVCFQPRHRPHSSLHVSSFSLTFFLQSAKRIAQGKISQRRCVFFCAHLLVSKHGPWATVHALHLSPSLTINNSLLNIFYLYPQVIFEGHEDWFPVQHQMWEGMGPRTMVTQTRSLILGSASHLRLCLLTFPSLLIAFT